MFENAEVAVEELPQVETVEWQGMDPKFVRRKLTDSAISLLFTVVIIGGLQTIFTLANTDDNPDVSFSWLWIIAVVVAIPFIAWPFISVPKIGYAVRERDIIYKSGVFWHTVTAVPFNRIQHVEKSSTPLDRRFNIATLQLFTAGGSGGDLKIHGLPAKAAEKLRFFILEKIGASVEQS
ncbi:MAG: PH domain-containing protein [Woeseiaceae bacterium]